ncbi:MAG TPA: methylmalonyl Co-A mutase-associated GTPase MeaB, partial [Anaerolineae bacterium]|nr:methylmalonyl Co-A mutase-associated GTPase MeaB [Anaerolineae bacterium]
LHYLAPATEGWRTRAYISSAVTGAGISEIWDVIQEFRQVTSASGAFETRRKAQMKDWLHSMIEEQLLHRFFNHPAIKPVLPAIEAAVIEGTVPTTSAVQELFQIFENKRESSDEH